MADEIGGGRLKQTASGQAPPVGQTPSAGQTPAGQTPLVGQTLGHYQIIEKIGSGGMGDVYRARDQHLDREVAIKVLTPGTLADEAARKRFRKEAQALSKLNHPNIATIHDFDTDQGVDFLVMEYIPGTTLNAKIAGRPLAEKEIARLGTQLARGLAAAHEQGVVHCDLKPGNVRLTRDGWLKILDFGLARLARPASADVPTESLTETQTTAGTLPYMAPEQLLGEKVDARTDIYAAGAVLYEMSTGQRPFQHSQGPRLIEAILHEEPAPPGKINSAISVGLESAVMRALEKDRERRQSSAKELLHNLEAVETGTGESASLLPTRAGSLWRRLTVREKAGAAVALVLACLLGFVLWSRSAAPALAFAASDYVLVSDFENQTGDPIFDHSLNAALTTSLEQSSHANVYPRARMKETLKRMEKPDADHIDEALALEIAQREGIKALVVPSISGIGESYRLAARIRAVASGKELKTEVARAKGKEKVLDAVDELAAGVRRDLGESLEKISENSKPLSAVTTQSLAALKQYSLGLERRQAADVQEAKTYYENALNIDPNFTTARASLGTLHLDSAAIGLSQFDAELGKRLLSEAAQHVSNLTDKEKYGILAAYAQWVERDLEKAAGYHKALLAIYPEYPVAYSNLAWVYSRMGRNDESIAAAKEALRIDPRLMIAYANLGGVQLYAQGDVKGALETCRQALQVDPGNAWAHGCVGWALFGEEDWAGAEAAFEKAVTCNPRSTLLRYRLAHAHRLRGNYPQAIEALEPIFKIEPSDPTPWYDMGVVYDEMGDHGKAREHFERYRQEMEAQWKKDPKDAGAAFSLAAALLRLGEEQKGWSLARKGVALDPNNHFEYATVLSLGGRKRDAIAQIQEAVKNGYRNYIWIKIHPDFESLHGEAEFQKLLAEAIRT